MWYEEERMEVVDIALHVNNEFGSKLKDSLSFGMK